MAWTTILCQTLLAARLWNFRPNPAVCCGKKLAPRQKGAFRKIYARHSEIHLPFSAFYPTVFPADLTLDNLAAVWTKVIGFQILAL